LLKARDVRLVKRHSIRFMCVLIDSRRGPLARPEVRQALLYGTDAEGLVRYVARGNGRPIATVTLPEDFGFHAGLKPYGFNPSKAKALLAEAGHPAGFRLQGLATHDTQTVATALAQQWAKLGVILDFTVESRATALSKWFREPERYDFLVGDPTSLIFDAALQLRMYLDPAHPMGRATQPQALELLNRADAEQNPEARAALLRDVQVIVHEKAVSIPLYQVVDIYGMRDRVTNFVPSADTILRLGGVGLAP
jgi:peptide/nickel transport system substrate-binding protein